MSEIDLKPPPCGPVKWFGCLKSVKGKKARKKARVTYTAQTWYKARNRIQVMLHCELWEMDAWHADSPDPMKGVK